MIASDEAEEIGAIKEACKNWELEQMAELNESALYPEIDSLEGFLHPRENYEFFGNLEAETSLQGAFLSNRMPTGWLITGPEGIGKATLAYRFARYAFAYSSGEDLSDGSPLYVNPKNTHFKRFAARSHPNLLVITRGYNPKKKNISTEIRVDQVRLLRRFLSLTAGNKGWRIVIVDNADECSIASFNALLKSLEEPPPQCVFLLTARSGAIPPTVRSRCRRLHLKPLDGSTLKSAVEFAMEASELHKSQSSNFDLISCLSGGSVRRALELIESDGITLYKQLLEILKDLPRLDHAMAHRLADKLSPKKAEFEFNLFIALLTDLLRRLIRAGAGSMCELDDEATIAQKIIRMDDLNNWAELWESINREKAEVLSLNLDKKNFVLQTFNKIEKAALSV